MRESKPLNALAPKTVYTPSVLQTTNAQAAPVNTPITQQNDTTHAVAPAMPSTLTHASNQVSWDKIILWLSTGN